MGPQRVRHDQVTNTHTPQQIVHTKDVPCAVLSRTLLSTLSDFMDYSPPGSSVPGDSPSKNTGVGCHALLWGNLPNPRIEPGSSALQVDSLTLSHQGNPKREQITVK